MRWVDRVKDDITEIVKLRVKAIIIFCENGKQIICCADSTLMRQGSEIMSPLICLIYLLH